MKISLDFWGTLYKSNPEFRKKRLILLREYGADPQVAQKLITEFKSEYKELEIKGIHTEFSDFLTQITNCGDDVKDIYTLDDELSSLFLKYPPFPIYKDLEKDLLKVKEEHDLYICSNVILTEGQTLQKFIWDRLEIPPINCKFSDEVDATKPDVDMFFKEVDYHIGDNEITDGACTKLGIKFFQVGDIITIKNFINENL